MGSKLIHVGISLSNREITEYASHILTKYRLNLESPLFPGVATGKSLRRVSTSTLQLAVL